MSKHDVNHTQRQCCEERILVCWLRQRVAAANWHVFAIWKLHSCTHARSGTESQLFAMYTYTTQSNDINTCMHVFDGRKNCNWTSDFRLVYCLYVVLSDFFSSCFSFTVLASNINWIVSVNEQRRRPIFTLLCVHELIRILANGMCVCIKSHAQLLENVSPVWLRATTENANFVLYFRLIQCNFWV